MQSFLTGLFFLGFASIPNGLDSGAVACFLLGIIAYHFYDIKKENAWE